MSFLDTVSQIALISTLTGVLVGCGGGGGSPPVVNNPSALAVNEVVVTVDNGPSGYNVNRLYTDVTICMPGTSTCQTIDHVLVDTGSSGLRILASELSANITSPKVKAVSGTPLVNCVQFVDNSFAWGPVVTVDVMIGRKTASAISVQVIGDAQLERLSASCATGDSNSTLAALGARGILGVGFDTEDCGVGCISNVSNGFYFSCTDAGCSAVRPSTAALALQVINPVTKFSVDSNGLSIELPAAVDAGQRSLVGKMVFGVDTQTNNSVRPGAVLPTNAFGYIKVTLDGLALPNSYIDSGSNGLYFESSTLPLCAGTVKDFFCPITPTVLSATLMGNNFVQTSAQISVASATEQFTNSSNSVLPRLAGPSGDGRTFDGGLPFFYGRRIVIGFAGKTSSWGTGPYYAF